MEIRDLGITMAEAGEGFAIWGKVYGKWLHTPEGRAFMIRMMLTEILTCKERNLRGALARLWAFCLRKERNDA